MFLHGTSQTCQRWTTAHHVDLFKIKQSWGAVRYIWDIPGSTWHLPHSPHGWQQDWAQQGVSMQSCARLNIIRTQTSWVQDISQTWLYVFFLMFFFWPLLLQETRVQKYTSFWEIVCWEMCVSQNTVVLNSQKISQSKKCAITRLTSISIVLQQAKDTTEGYKREDYALQLALRISASFLAVASVTSPRK